MNEKGIVTRVTVMAAVMAAAMLLGLPAFNMGVDMGESFGAVGSAEAVSVDRVFTIGVGELTADSLNPNTATMVSEYLLIYYSYSYLWGYDEDANIIGDLATNWSVSPDGLVWDFDLAENAYFCDPANPTAKLHKVTSSDVKFTFEAVQASSSSRLHFYFPGIIDSIDDSDPAHVTIVLNEYFAAIKDSWSGCPILPEYIWDGESFNNFANLPPIGSGPLYYATDGLPDVGGAELKRNPIWFQTDNKGWKLHTDKWLIKEVLSADAALIDLNTGELDCYLRLTPELYLEAIGSTQYPNTIGFSQAAGFVYEYNLNQMTDELRSEIGGSFNGGSNNQLLLNPVVKTAMAMAVDKDAFVDDPMICAGLGSYADSLVPPNNPQHYWIPDPIEFDLTAARQLLYDAGWEFDKFGNPATGDTCPLAKMGGTDVLSFRFYTLDTSVVWENAANKLADWAREIGVELNLQIKTVSEMNSIWYSANYDVWLWDWVMGVLGDASGIMEVYTTMSIGVSSDVYTSDPYFDALYNLSLETVDEYARQEILDEMQEWAYWNLGCQCIAYSNDNYGVSTVNWAPESLGDWNTKYLLLPDINCQWNSMQMYPHDNHAPQFTSYTGSGGPVELDVGESGYFYVSANDDDVTTPLEYRWFWGDGQSTSWSSSGTAYHTYAASGKYETWVAVREAGLSNGVDDYFQTSGQVTVLVYGSNLPPTGVSFTYAPLLPDAGTYVTFTATATDPEGDPLYYFWDFGDGNSGSGQVTEYQFGADGTFDVTLSVTDMKYGQGTRPVQAGQGVPVSANYAPTVAVGDFPDKQVGVSYVFDVTGSDPEDALRYTWFWGDGDVSVTTVPTTSHTYDVRSTYTLKVWADDLTGIPGHNVSDTGSVHVYNPSNHAPTISSFKVNDKTAFTWQSLIFTAIASDPDGDAMTYTVSFGDGTPNFVGSVGINSGQLITVLAQHAYTSGGSKIATLTVTDGIATTTPSTATVTVTLNHQPEFLESLPDISAEAGEVVFVEVFMDDQEGDPLIYTFEWGDGAVNVTTSPYARHTYLRSMSAVYTVFVDDGKDHIVYASANVDITDFTLEIVAGWNLVTIPYADSDYTARTLGLGFGDIIYGYDPTMGYYDTMFIVGVFPSEADFLLQPLVGYWVYANSPVTLVLEGRIIASERAIDVPTSGGWALVGVPSVQGWIMASDLVDMYSGTVDGVFAYNAALGFYDKFYVPGVPELDFVITPGMGLWMHCLTDGDLSYVP